MIALDRLGQIIPPDLALANKALATSLQQIAGIQNLSLATLSEVAHTVETTRDLPLITAQTQAVPTSVTNYYASNLAQGGGPNGTIRIVDIIGSAGGWPATDVLTQTLEIFATMDLIYLTLVYQTMKEVMDGTYGDPIIGPVIIPSGLPGAGDYYATSSATPNPTPPPAFLVECSAADNAMTGLDGDTPSTGPGLIPVANTTITNLVATYPEQTIKLNTLWNSMAVQVQTEQNLQPKAQLNFANLTASDIGPIYGFIFNLSAYGLDTQSGGMAQFVELIADTTTQGGQAIVACLRQGRNQAVLNSAGINTNSNIPADPATPPPPAKLIPSTYTDAEAAALLAPKR